MAAILIATIGRYTSTLYVSLGSAVMEEETMWIRLGYFITKHTRLLSDHDYDVLC